MVRLTNAIGDTLRAIRTENHLTLRDVSQRAHVALGHISDIERGVKTASNETLEAIAYGLDVSVTDLIGEIYAYLMERNHEV